MAQPGRTQAGRMGALAALAFALSAAAPAQAQAQFRQKIGNDPARCDAGAGPAVRVTVKGIESSRGVLRVQSYRGIEADWLEKGRWLSRIEIPARAGTMVICMPVPAAGRYGIAVRHDANGNGKSDLSKDGGGMSNNPSLNLFNLGKPSYKKAAFEVGKGVTDIQITMKYM